MNKQTINEFESLRICTDNSTSFDDTQLSKDFWNVKYFEDKYVNKIVPMSSKNELFKMKKARKSISIFNGFSTRLTMNFIPQ